MTHALLAAILASLLIAFMPTVAVVLLVLAVLYGCVCWRGEVIKGRFKTLAKAKDYARNDLRRRARLEGWPAGMLEDCLAKVNRVDITQYKSLMSGYQR